MAPLTSQEINLIRRDEGDDAATFGGAWNEIVGVAGVLHARRYEQTPAWRMTGQRERGRARI